MQSKGHRSDRIRLPVATILVFVAALTWTLAAAPGNDDCDQPVVVTSLPFVAVEAAIEEATSSSDPADPVPGCATPGNKHSVWYEITAATDGWIRVSTSGSDYDTVAWVGTGSCGAYTQIACDDDGGAGLASRVAFEVAAGQTYAIMIGSWSTLTDGTLQVLIEEELTPPTTSTDQTWTLAESPKIFGIDHVILPGVTVTVEPGVVLQIQPGVTLSVQGSLVGAGTPALPIRIVGSFFEVTGSVELSWAEVGALMESGMNGFTSLTDTTFTPGSRLMNIGGSVILLDRCTFDGAFLWLPSTSMVRIRDTSVNDFAELGGGFLSIENFSSTASPYGGLRLYGYEQPVHLDDVSVTGAAGPGLDLIAGNYFIGANVQLQGNEYPAQIGGAGILPGSTLPAAGNLNDMIKVEDASWGAWSMVWADAGIPYAMTGGQYHAGALEILPGVTVLLEPNFTLWGDGERVDARGTPEAPVRFEQLVPGQTWQGLQYFHHFENCVIDGGQVGARMHSATFPGYIDNCIIQNNDFGMQNDAHVRKTRFLNNTVGAWGNDWDLGLESETNPNSFVGNGDAVQDFSGHIVDAGYNWWDDPSGPTSPDNPGGSGQTVVGCCIETLPFLTAEPDFNDNPPMVRLLPGPRRENPGGAYSSFVDPGTAVIVSWDSEDDVAVVGHRVEFYNSWTFTWTVVAELPGDQRSFEWIVPDIGPTANSSVPRLRVVAIDSAGQEGWDEYEYQIPSGDVPGTLTVTTDLGGSPFVMNETIGELCVDAVGNDPYDMIVWEISFDGDRRHIPLGSHLGGGCLAGAGVSPAPYVSSDTVRYRAGISRGQNRVSYFFSDFFTVRPDPRIGDTPPTVTLTSPVGGESFPGGSIVPIVWTASDAEGLRGIDIQVSSDGGRTWHFIAQDLPPTATTFDWRLPPSAGLADVRVRVMVSDLRFQTSSSGGDVTFAVGAGSGGCVEPPGEVDGVTVDADKIRVLWSSMPGSVTFDVGRGDLDGLAAGAPATCLASGSPQTFHDDVDVPVPGTGFYYLIGATNGCGPGPLGPPGPSRAGACP